MTQNQLIELFETDQLKTIVERSEERGWVDPAELEGFVTEQELGSEEVEQITRELEAMGLEIGAPIDTEEEKAKEAAEAAVWASESLSGAADSLQLFLADVGRHKLLNAAQEVQLAKTEMAQKIGKARISGPQTGWLTSAEALASGPMRWSSPMISAIPRSRPDSRPMPATRLCPGGLLLSAQRSCMS